MTLDHFDRIIQNPDIMGGKPYLEHEDILQSLQYAAWLAQGREVALR